MKNTSLVLSALMATTATTVAQHAGDLDSTFSADGKLTTDFGLGNDYGNSIAIQADGKIVVGGSTFNGVRLVFGLARYHSDGTPDNSIDSDGILSTDFGTSSNLGYAIVIQADGRIVVAGYSDNGTDYDFALARYHADGTLDSSFSADGKLVLDFNSTDDEGYAIALQADQKIVVAGSAGTFGGADFALARFHPDGSPDNTFSTDGRLTTAFGSGESFAHSVAIQPDGKIVVAGFSDNGSDFVFAVARYNTDGTLDNSFSADGKATTALGTDSRGYSVVIQPDGKIVVAGRSEVASPDFALARYNSNGTLDSSFSADGKVTTAIGSSIDEAFSVAIQSDGKIVVAGSSYAGGLSDFAVARYRADGILDSTFSADGKTTTGFGVSHDEAASIAIQDDGRIVVAGYSENGPDDDFAVARYMADCPPLTQVTQAGPILTSTIPGASYQWLDCNKAFVAISGATNQSFTASTNGSYAVIVTKNGCSDTSACYTVSGLGMLTVGTKGDATVYPNPTAGLITVSLPEGTGAVHVEVIDITGRVISTHSFVAGDDVNVSVGEAAGPYSILITTTEHKQYRFMVVKE
jgi:uncharacterized delta-60 repeat protein